VSAAAPGSEYRRREQSITLSSLQEQSEQAREGERSTQEMLTLNFGPHHPATHGVLRLLVTLRGEIVQDIKPIVGYVHTGIEKTAEDKSYWKVIPVVERMDYLAYHFNSLAYIGAVETLAEVVVPTRVQYLRVIHMELNRIMSHLVWLGTSALDLGAISMFWYCFREREQINDLFEMSTGQRMHTRYFQIGGLAEDIPEGFYAQCHEFVEWMPKALNDYLTLLDRNKIWLERTKGVGLLSAEDAIALGQTGPVLRASGVDWDLRREQPYLAYANVDFNVPVYPEGDVFARYRVRVDEMRESTRIVDQCLRRLERMRGRPWITDDRKVVLPPREELHTSMESLIHHFKIVTEGFRVPEGEVYVAIESPRGEQGCYLVSEGGPKPWRVHFRAPSFVALEATATCTHDALVADLIAIVGSLDAVMGDTDR
jgi:NADH-quinone oxidoreductase subunit D